MTAVMQADVAVGPHLGDPSHHTSQSAVVAVGGEVTAGESHRYSRCSPSRAEHRSSRSTPAPYQVFTLAVQEISPMTLVSAQ